jgi:hypothetical protein
MAAGDSGELERLLTELSMRFAGLPVEQIDEEIERRLRLLVEFLDTDRGTLSEFSPDETRFIHIAAWARWALCGNTLGLCGNTWFPRSYGANGVSYRVVPSP